MKKFYFMAFIATAVLTMTSCSNDDIAGTGSEISKNEATQAINFSTYLGRAPQSRAAITETGSNMGVYAFLTTAAYGQNTNMVPNFMCNQEVTKPSDGDTNVAWTYSPIKYWPNNTTDKISFFAYAPYGAKGITMSDKEATGTPTATVTLQSANEMVDFVAGNAMNQIYTSNTSTNGLVNFTLKHEMTRVAFKAKTTVADGTTVKITSVTLSGKKLYGTGKYTFSTGTTQGTWEVSDNSTYTLEVPVGNGIELTNGTGNNEKSIYSYLFLIPVETLAKDEVKATIEYEITTADEKLKESITTSASKTVSLTANTLVQGSAYVYTFDIGLKAVTLSASVAGWDGETNNDVEVPAQDTSTAE